MFSEGPARERDAAIGNVAHALGYRRTGPRIREILHNDLLIAVRRGILENTGGELGLVARSITDYDRAFLKQQFLAAIGRTWIDRDEPPATSAAGSASPAPAPSSRTRPAR